MWPYAVHISIWGPTSPQLCQHGPKSFQDASKFHSKFVSILKWLWDRFLRKPGPKLAPNFGLPEGSKKWRRWFLVALEGQVVPKPLQDLPQELPGSIFHRFVMDVWPSWTWKSSKNGERGIVLRVLSRFISRPISTCFWHRFGDRFFFHFCS